MGDSPKRNHLSTCHFRIVRPHKRMVYRTIDRSCFIADLRSMILDAPDEYKFVALT